MNFTYTKVYNFENAFRGMRNPLNSWYKSDSFFGLINLENDFPDYDWVVDGWIENENKIRSKKKLPLYTEDHSEFYEIIEKYCSWMRDTGILNQCGDIADVAFLGPEDLKLAQKLIIAGKEHAKFMRQIFVSVDISAPIYWWKEMDTYKIGTTANSTSTMHKLTSEPITLKDFEFDYKTDIQKEVVECCECIRQHYIDTEDKKYWRMLIQTLPESYIQTRTWTANYAILRNIYYQRLGHKLKEWKKFCEWVETLPYGTELITL